MSDRPELSNEARESSVSVCFVTRNPRRGSWRIRGGQIADMRSNWAAKRIRNVTDEDLERFDVFTFVKKPDAGLLERVLSHGKLAVHDVVDWWRQPRDHRRVHNPAQARQLFNRRWSKLPAFHGHIFACGAMYDDLASLSPFPEVIYHHHWPGLKPESFRTGPLRVGYEGKGRYLGGWRKIVTKLCDKHGMEFVSQRVRTQPVDIGFAARGERFGGYLPDRYKSNVKLANCYGAGIPAIMPAVQASYRETATDGVAWFETPADIDRALAALRDDDTRRRMGQANLAAAARFNVATIANRYEDYFQRLRSRRNPGRSA